MVVALDRREEDHAGPVEKDTHARVAHGARGPVKRFVFWQSYLMVHQAGYIRALAERQGLEIKWVVEQPLHSQYRKRGYPVPELGRVQAVIAPDTEKVRELLADEQGHTVHVFMGLRRSRLSGRAFQASKAYPVRRLLLSENRFEPNWRLPARWLLYLYQGLSSRRYLDRLLCMGYEGKWSGRTWFRLCGYPDRLISPFVYTSEEGADEQPRLVPPTRDVVFVGQLVRRKGLDLLLEAMAGNSALRERTLTVIGTGPEESALKQSADRLGLGGRVEFLGGHHHGEVSSIVARHRMLALPSRYDGWGAVVNEAILAGTPVVCSDRVGASDLVLGSGYGRVFSNGDVADLGRCLVECLPISESPEHRQEWVRFRESMRGPSVAQYLLDVIAAVDREEPMPHAPWLPHKGTAPTG